MFYNKPNFKTAQPLAGHEDIENLKNLGIEYMSRMANAGSVAFKASIQRLVNSGILPEGRY